AGHLYDGRPSFDFPRTQRDLGAALAGTHRRPRPQHRRAGDLPGTRHRRPPYRPQAHGGKGRARQGQLSLTLLALQCRANVGRITLHRSTGWRTTGWRTTGWRSTGWRPIACSIERQSGGYKRRYPPYIRLGTVFGAAPDP